MKKIIAAAVATAFVAPAFAADITISGALEYTYTKEDGAAALFEEGDNGFKITATSELDNGMAITGVYNVLHDASDSETNGIEHDGSSLSVSGDFGAVTIGDTSGALDATGDWSDKSPAGANFDTADGDDHAFRYTLPGLVDGLKLEYSFSPDGDNDMSSNRDEVSDGAQSVALTYTMGDYAVYWGTQQTKDSTSLDHEDDVTAYGFKANVGAIYAALESATKEDGDGTTGDIEYTGYAVTYSMGKMTLGIEDQEVKTAAATFSKKETAIFATYDLGGGLTSYAVQVADDKTTTPTDSTHIGVIYAF